MRFSMSELPPDLVFFTDRNLGKIVPRILRGAGLQVERHDDHFGPTTVDEEWLAKVGHRGWVALTHDKRIRYISRQTEALMDARVRAFLLIGHVPHQALAENFVATLSRINIFLQRHDGPFIAKVYRPSGDRAVVGAAGRVQMWLTYEDWLEGR